MDGCGSEGGGSYREVGGGVHTELGRVESFFRRRGEGDAVVASTKNT
jgi:hypothetical protein